MSFFFNRRSKALERSIKTILQSNVCEYLSVYYKMNIGQENRDPLLSLEELDGRRSPDLWPEQIPGVSEYATKIIKEPTVEKADPHERLRLDLERDDMCLMNDLGQLEPDKLVVHIKALQNLAYQLGLEEAKQLTRGKYLCVLENPAKNISEF